MISIRCHTKQQQRICCIMRETESVIMTKNVNRYPKRMWRTAAVVRKTVRCHPSNRFFTPIHRFVSRFPTKHSCLRSEWPETVRRHSKRQQRICYSVKERDSNGKNRDWVSLLVYKEVAGEAGRRILAWGSDAKGQNDNFGKARHSNNGERKMS